MPLILLNCLTQTHWILCCFVSYCNGRLSFSASFFLRLSTLCCATSGASHRIHAWLDIHWRCKQRVFETAEMFSFKSLVVGLLLHALLGKASKFHSAPLFSAFGLWRTVRQACFEKEIKTMFGALSWFSKAQAKQLDVFCFRLTKWNCFFCFYFLFACLFFNPGPNYRENTEIWNNVAYIYLSAVLFEIRIF